MIDKLYYFVKEQLKKYKEIISNYNNKFIYYFDLLINKFIIIKFFVYLFFKIIKDFEKLEFYLSTY
jgi:hypothetical protein